MSLQAACVAKCRAHYHACCKMWHALILASVQPLDPCNSARALSAQHARQRPTGVRMPGQELSGRLRNPCSNSTCSALQCTLSEVDASAFTARDSLRAVQIYLRMWDVHCCGSGPRSFEV